MSRQLEAKSEERESRRAKLLVRAVRRDLDAGVQSDGCDLLGFSAKLSGGDCLLTLRAENGAGSVICFVGGEDLESAIIKAVQAAKSGELRWRPDKYART